MSLKPINHEWDPNFMARSPMLSQFTTVIAGEGGWPSIADYNRAIEQSVTTRSGLPITFKVQDKLLDNYEKTIYETGNVPTRPQHWHDYFNALAWLNFPKTKAVINHLQYQAINSRQQKQRTAIENLLTLFDENGAIVCSTDTKLLEMLRNHEWVSLFYDNCDRVKDALQVTVFGHSLHEKALQPYIGMTAHCLLFEGDQKNLDSLVSRYLLDHRTELCTRLLCPLPILGYPGWHFETQGRAFYMNARYFRVK